MLLGAPTSAAAGTYEVSLCTGPDNSAIGTSGWAPFVSYQAGTSRDECADRSGNRRFVSTLAANTSLSNGKYVGWSFTAPPGTTISRYTLWRSVRAAHGGSLDGDFWAHAYFLWEDARVPGDEQYGVEGCVEYSSSPCFARGDPRQPHSAANRVTRSRLELKRLFATMECYGPSSTCQPAATPGEFRIYAARIGLSDSHVPVISKGPSGSLLDSSTPREGEHAVRFAVRDEGGGVSRVGIVIDGKPVVARALETGNRSCVVPYSATVPCPASGEVTLPFDTKKIVNGAHTVQASVTDAGGNETRSDPVTVTTLNGSQPNGRGASRFVKLSAWVRSRRNTQQRSAIVPFGSVRTAEGRLTDAAGSPIGGAVLQAVSRVQRPGAAYKAAGTVTTSDSGRFAYRVARGPSRTLRFEYKAYSLDPAPVSSAAVSLGVRAGIRLGVNPRRVRNGEKVRFRGRLKGGPARKGTRVTIDVIVPDARRRVPIGNVKADARGRFRFAYRFRRTLVAARYRFQARVVPQPGYPYRGATSHRVSVMVQP